MRAFGDGAGAVVLEHSCSGSKEDRGILSVDLNSDGNYKIFYMSMVV